MDSKRINTLLDKYWNCETTLEEEQELREYFSNGEFSEKMRDTAMLFRFFEENRKAQIDDVSFDQQVLRKINRRSTGKVRRLLFNSMRIAAGVAVLVVATWLVREEIRSGDPDQATDTYNDPQLAFEETKKALMMISKSFGTAEEEARKINLFNEAQEQVQKREQLQKAEEQTETNL